MNLPYAHANINNSSHFALKYSRILVGHYLFLPEHVFAPNGGYCVYFPSNIFRNTSSLENWGISLGYSFSRGILSHVTRLDQSRANLTVSWIILLYSLNFTTPKFHKL